MSIIICHMPNGDTVRFTAPYGNSIWAMSNEQLMELAHWVYSGKHKSGYIVKP